MQTLLTFDDVLIRPQFSTVKSRKDVDLSTKLGSLEFSLPLISANMDTVTGPKMVKAMLKSGAQACLHRFMSPLNNGLQYSQTAEEVGSDFFVSVGIGEDEFGRFKNLYNCGARHIVIDVAHGAQQTVADQYMRIKNHYPDVFIVVGNFANSMSIMQFTHVCKGFDGAFKVGVGPGSSCTTRIKTGVGVPQLSAIIECVRTGYPVIADGGCKTPGDLAKALAAGAVAVMVGSMLSGTEETPGDVVDSNYNPASSYPDHAWYKKYRGSASKESYTAQGKDQGYITAEGEAFLVPYKGPVANILQDIEGGLRSSFSYVGALNLEEFHKKAQFVEITANALRENGAHGNKLSI